MTGRVRFENNRRNPCDSDLRRNDRQCPRLAEVVSEGVSNSGAKVGLRRVGELAPEEPIAPAALTCRRAHRASPTGRLHARRLRGRPRRRTSLNSGICLRAARSIEISAVESSARGWRPNRVKYAGGIERSEMTSRTFLAPSVPALKFEKFTDCAGECWVEADVLREEERRNGAHHGEVDQTLIASEKGAEARQGRFGR